MYTIITQTKSDQLYEQLRNAIIQGEYAPSEKINIAEVARRYGVSEIPVREAFHQLEERNLVTRIPYKGFFVQSISLKEWKDHWYVRDALERLAIHQIFEHSLKDEDFQEMRTILAAAEQSLANEDFDRFSKLNRDFHMAMYKLSQNSYLLELIDSVWDEVERASRVYKYARRRPPQSQNEHCKMLEYLQDGNKKQLLRLFKGHRAVNCKILQQHWENSQ